MPVHAWMLTALLLTGPAPCDNPAYRQDLDTQCMKLVGNGESLLKAAVKVEKTGDLKAAAAQYAEAYRNLRAGLDFTRRPDVHVFNETVIRLFTVRMTEACGRLERVLAQLGGTAEDIQKQVRALEDAADEEMRTRVDCFLKSRE
ncbi:MAG TPA: hypothetical protein VN436_03620 [Holophaga sp.]|nr:hypothetical protein [Holophaga sp.]